MIDIETIIASANFDEHSRARVNCPVCPVRAARVDFRRSLKVDLISGQLFCFACNWKARVPGHIFFEELETLEPAIGEDYDVYDFAWPEEMVPVVANSPFVGLAKQYLRSRAVSKKAATEADIRVAISGKYHGMVIVPFLDHDRAWAGWQGRSVTGPKRYHTQKDRSIKMFNWTALEVETEEPVMVVEGTFDALPYWPNAVCCLGKPTDTHVDMLANAKRPVVVVLDRDARKEGQVLAETLRGRGQCASSLGLVDFKDPNDIAVAGLRNELWDAVLQESRDARKVFSSSTTQTPSRDGPPNVHVQQEDQDPLGGLGNRMQPG